jgi:DNA polymerase sigma
MKILTKTRVPIIKMTDSETDLNIDIGYNNYLGVFNTRMLAAYAQIDKRFRQLVMIVKYWAKRRTINDTYSGTLSSYAYVLMIIHYLQYVCYPPVLPNLQQIEAREVIHKTSDEQEFNVYFFDDIPRLMLFWEIRNKETLGELLFGFFYYYAHIFDYKTQVVSIRTGTVLTKEEKGWVPLVEQEKRKQSEDATNKEEEDRPGKKDRLQRYWVCIEDPFEVEHNLGRPVGRDSLYFIRGEFLLAFSIFGNAKFYSLQYLMKMKIPLYNKSKSDESGKLTVLQGIMEESKYKTREEHKKRNKENRDIGEKRKAKSTAIN